MIFIKRKIFKFTIKSVYLVEKKIIFYFKLAITINSNMFETVIKASKIFIPFDKYFFEVFEINFIKKSTIKTILNANNNRV